MLSWSLSTYTFSFSSARALSSGSEEIYQSLVPSGEITGPSLGLKLGPGSCHRGMSLILFLGSQTGLVTHRHQSRRTACFCPGAHRPRAQPHSLCVSLLFLVYKDGFLVRELSYVFFHTFSFLKVVFLFVCLFFGNCCVFIAESVPQNGYLHQQHYDQKYFLIFFFFNDKQLLLCYNKYIGERATSTGFLAWPSSPTVAAIVSWSRLTSGCWGRSEAENWRHREGATLSKTFPWEREKGTLCFVLF